MACWCSPRRLEQTSTRLSISLFEGTLRIANQGSSVEGDGEPSPAPNRCLEDGGGSKKTVVANRVESCRRYQCRDPTKKFDGVQNDVRLTGPKRLGQFVNDAAVFEAQPLLRKRS
jgi:hypothetical protein